MYICPHFSFYHIYGLHIMYMSQFIPMFVHFSYYNNVILSRCFQSIRPTHHVKVSHFSPCMCIPPLTTILSCHDVFKVYGLRFIPIWSTLFALCPIWSTPSLDPSVISSSLIFKLTDSPLHTYSIRQTSFVKNMWVNNEMAFKHCKQCKLRSSDL